MSSGNVGADDGSVSSAGRAVDRPPVVSPPSAFPNPNPPAESATATGAQSTGAQSTGPATAPNRFHGTSLHLMDMRGSIVHTWKPEFFTEPYTVAEILNRFYDESVCDQRVGYFYQLFEACKAAGYGCIMEEWREGERGDCRRSRKSKRTHFYTLRS